MYKLKFTKEQEQKLIEFNKKIEENGNDYKEFSKWIVAKNEYLKEIQK